MRNTSVFAAFGLVAGVFLAAELAWPVVASAEVVAVSGNGFTVRETAEIAATPDKVYEALVRPQDWWSSDHTFSGSAANLSLDANAGGCFCETVPNSGTVKHQEVVLAAPGKTLVMRGALGPLQATGTIDA